MPKKTREEKIVASYRKKLKLLGQYDNKTTANKKDIDLKTVTSPTKEKTSATVLNEEDLMIKAFFLKDFSRSISLILFIIALEIILYFASIKGAFVTYLKI